VGSPGTASGAGAGGGLHRSGAAAGLRAGPERLSPGRSPDRARGRRRRGDRPVGVGVSRAAWSTRWPWERVDRCNTRLGIGQEGQGPALPLQERGLSVSRTARGREARLRSCGEPAAEGSTTA